MTTTPADPPIAGRPDSAIQFPDRPADPRATVLIARLDGDRLPTVVAVGTAARLGGDPAGAVAAAGEWGTAMLPEHWTGRTTRPGLRGHRLDPTGTGRDWSSRFRVTGITQATDLLTIRARDDGAGLELTTEVAALPGGPLRMRHTLLNVGERPYAVEGLDVVLPCPDDHVEAVDFTGRHERERSLQRHGIGDGLRLREGRQGRPGLDAATLLATGPAGFGFGRGAVLAVHAGWSGNQLLRLERDAATGTTVGAGEHLLSGEVTLERGQSYASPWVYVVAADDGLDGVAAATHRWLRTLPAHPRLSPVTLNVWEAVYFDHDLDRLMDLADRAARIGVERYVLDDGWFHLRRDDHAGLGDWWVDPAVWPDGLDPLVTHVESLGMQFGLWFEPEMVNPDSDLYRAHPDWVLATGGREPLLHRNQLVLDLSRPEVQNHLFDRVHAVLSAHRIGYVKWDHNRDLLEAGTATRGGAPAAHETTLGFYRLLDRLRAAHPAVEWESCASGGGRIDLGVLERVQRVWTSDMTDALARQTIQHGTVQLVPLEYLGAHVSAPVSHQTGRTLPLDFRAATALFGAFGVEWDISTADEDELADLAGWVDRFKRFRSLLHGGRVARIDSADPAVLLHGVVADDGAEALVAHVQMDESESNRGVHLRVPGLVPDRRYRASWAGPVDGTHVSAASPVPTDGPTGGRPVTGRVLASAGLWIPRRRPQTVLLIHLTPED